MTDLAGVIGYPIEHSKSPLIHNYWIKKHNLNAVYVPLRVKPDDLTDVLKSLSKAGFKGVNLTVPHKTLALGMIDSLSDEARKAGAVNTVVFKDDGSVYGHNTDGFGFVRNLQSVKPDLDVSRSVVAVFGTGGAARGICAALTTLNCKEIRLAYRTLEKARALKESVGGNVVLVPWRDKDDALKGADVIANATTLGMNGFAPLETDLSLAGQNAIVTDAVYAPLETDLLKAAKARGMKTADGLGMLLWQAAPAFKEFFGVSPEVDDGLRRAVL